LINHPEASWIVDDVYRQMATKEQKAKMLREWYGPEYAVFKSEEKNPSADLAKILEQEPEKRRPIMKYLYGLINQLIQKQLSGFTMLHDAMLQYFLNTKPGTEEANSFLELIKGDEEGDLLRNLAFTKGGSRVVSLALAYGGAKDRKNILRVYKDHIEALATDGNGHMVLLAGLDVTDDTKLTSKSILNELIGHKESGEGSQVEKIIKLVNDLNGRIPLLYPFAGTSRWLIPQKEFPIVQEYQAVRASTSKKDPEIRCKELALPISKPCLTAISSHAATLVQSSFGCQFIETVLCGPTESQDLKASTLDAIASTASGDPNSEDHIARSFHGGRMLRTLVQGGEWSAATQSVKATDPPRGFANALYNAIKPHVVEWACGDSPLVLVNMLERAQGFEHQNDLIKQLKAGKAKIQKAATEETAKQKEKRAEAEKRGTGKGRKGKVVKTEVGNPGAKKILELIA
jgi:pumilio homology domain family member 6